jgi:hypothetical protein
MILSFRWVKYLNIMGGHECQENLSDDTFIAPQ